MSKEYVTKEKVIETILSYGIGWGSARVRGVINNIPADDVVEVRHGLWKFHEDGSGTCQECGCRQKYVWDVNGWQNYCGHCGADMRNGEQDK